MPQRIHIVDRFDVPWSGSAKEAIGTAHRLAGAAHVQLWSDEPPHPSYDGAGIAHIGPDGAPKEGTLLISGGYYQPGAWLEQGRFARVLIRFNTTSNRAYVEAFTLLGRLRQAGLPAPELSFISALLRKEMGLEGLVAPSPIDTERFAPAATRPPRPFTIGRHSRDVEFKHHPDDIAIYRTLALAGHQVRILGGTVLAPRLGRFRQGIELLPAGAQAPEEFLRSIDCFYYRTHPLFTEALGYVVIEAMATGIPVVCERRGGFAEVIAHGKNGLLFDTDEEGLACLQRLAADPAFSAELGLASCETARLDLGMSALGRYQDWLLPSAAI
jgi:glycosyltransferase involved in cell wall biosynthesis